MLDDEEFLRSLRETFRVEADELVRAISTGLFELERAPGSAQQSQTIETIFRAAHSLKGAARAVNLAKVEAICQGMEDIFHSWNQAKEAPSQAIIDALHRSLDVVSREIENPDGGGAAPVPVAPGPSFEVRTKSLPPPAPAPVPAARPAPPVVEMPSAPPPEPVSVNAPAALADTVRISVAKLDARLLEAEELLAAKLVSNQRVTDLAGLTAEFDGWRREWQKVQPSVRTLRQEIERSQTTETRGSSSWSHLVDFFDWSHDYLRLVEGRLATLHRAAEGDQQLIGRLVDDLLEDSKKLLMLPLSTLGGLLPKVVRDLARDQGKQADLVIRGEEVEIDKRIIEEMKDPLIHLLRNAVDHGIEGPEVRVRAGKPSRATITLSVLARDGNQVELRLTDDGAGIDPERVRASAIQHRIVNAEAAAQLNEAAALDLIFQSAVSTSPIITQVSGRGLGLAIVRERAEKLGGHVRVETQRGRGTTFSITLPMALATFRGILLEVSQQKFVIPTLQVERVTRFRMSDVKTIEGREALAIDDRTTALVRLSAVLGLEQSEVDAGAALPLILLGSGEQRIAFAVDAVLGEHEVLVKPLTKPLLRVRNVSGATVLGSGQVAVILNVQDLLKSARRTQPSIRSSVAAEASATAAKSILIAEDSITSRMLLKGVLESAGYLVTTAVDGLAAFTALRAGEFDLLVSDVEMPRLNGFDLTTRVRADRKLTELPVILVTALESREHRERGIDAGANAYLVKSNFDQSDLLETVRRLL